MSQSFTKSTDAGAPQSAGRGKEIERKFLVRGEAWRALGTPVPYCQGYLNSSPGRTVRVRIAGSAAFLTIKGPNRGAVRTEYEYPIPVEDARVMLETLCERPLIEKTRTRIAHAGRIWEVDEFSGENEGLVVAEVELEDENGPHEKGDSLLKHVTGDPRYYNSSLIAHPYAHWRRQA